MEKNQRLLNKLGELKSILIALKQQKEKLVELFEDVEREESNHKFSFDGHLLGSIGECLANVMNPSIHLKKNSTGGYDATYLNSNTRLEIKTTTIDRVRFVKEYDKVLVVKLDLEKLEILEDDEWVRVYYLQEGVKLENKKSRTIQISQLKGKEWTGKID